MKKTTQKTRFKAGDSMGVVTRRLPKFGYQLDYRSSYQKIQNTSSTTGRTTRDWKLDYMIFTKKTILEAMCRDGKMKNSYNTTEINPATKFKTKTHFKRDYFRYNCYWRNMIGIVLNKQTIWRHASLTIVNVIAENVKLSVFLLQ